MKRTIMAIVAVATLAGVAVQPAHALGKRERRILGYVAAGVVGYSLGYDRGYERARERYRYDDYRDRRNYRPRRGYYDDYRDSRPGYYRYEYERYERYEDVDYPRYRRDDRDRYYYAPPPCRYR